MYNSTNRPIDEAEILAIFVCKTGDDQRHVGFYYKLEDSLPTLCHLAWHCKLNYETDPPQIPSWSKSPLFWQSIELSDVNKNIFAAWLHTLKRDSNFIAYGIKVVPPVFTQDGRYIPQQDGRGMTCATFIMEAFRSISLPFLDETTWPSRPEDEVWQEHIIMMLGKNVADTSHLNAMKDDIGCIRFKPEEVASAALQSSRPTSFEECRSLAEEISGLCSGCE